MRPAHGREPAQRSENRTRASLQLVPRCLPAGKGVPRGTRPRAKHRRPSQELIPPTAGGSELECPAETSQRARQCVSLEDSEQRANTSFECLVAIFEGAGLVGTGPNVCCLIYECVAHQGLNAEFSSCSDVFVVGQAAEKS